MYVIANVCHLFYKRSEILFYRSKAFFLYQLQISNVYFSPLQAKVIAGDEREATGSLISMEGNDGIFKCQENDSILMVPLNTLAKMAD